MTMNRILTAALALAAPALVAAMALTPGAAQARWYGGVVVGVPYAYPYPYPYVAPPPVYYPAPAYVAPAAPVYASPAQTDPSAPPPLGQSCRAGNWVCPLSRATPVGDSCSCPTSDGRAWGRAQ